MSKKVIEYDDEEEFVWEPKNIEDFQDMEEIARIYNLKLYDTATEFAEANGDPTPGIIDDCDIWYPGKGFYYRVDWERYDKDDGYKSSSLKVPIQYLWEEDWAKDFREEKIRKNIEAVRKRQEKEKKDKIARDARQYKQYLALKKKFDVLDEEATSRLLAKGLI
jgi:hypothetical protein